MGSTRNWSGAVKWPLASRSKPARRLSLSTPLVGSSPSRETMWWSAVSTAGGFPERCSSVPRTAAGGLWARQAAARQPDSKNAPSRIAFILAEWRVSGSGRHRRASIARRGWWLVDGGRQGDAAAALRHRPGRHFLRHGPVQKLCEALG